MAIQVSSSSVLFNTINRYAHGAAIGLAVGLTAGAAALAIKVITK